MLVHIFALRWKQDTPAHLKQDALDAVRAFPGQIPGILSLQAGTNTSSRAKGYETIGILHFAGQPALHAYLTHPTHQAFVDMVGPYIEAIDLDLETA